ncbi:type II secretion system protein [Massilia sp. YMA4]|nr:type II secretion system protein [Massilia sp. YMA4]
MRAGRPHRAAGFTYVVMLAALAIFGVGLAALGQTWSEASRREREQELLQVGAAYATAIAAYHRLSPGGTPRYPLSLDELVDDRRFVGTVRHLRRLYLDPVTRSPLEPVRDRAGLIVGVRSVSTVRALRRMPYQLPSGGHIDGERYMDWQFVYVPSGLP